MKEFLENLGNLSRSMGIDQIFEESKGSDERSRQINNARRGISHYFRRASKLYTNDFISKKLLDQIASDDGWLLMCDVVAPLERKKNPDA